MGLYYEPSGHMVEPDSNKKSPMGTREVDAYTVTPHEMFEETSIEEDMIAEFAAVPPDGLRQDVTSLHKRDRTARWSQAAADRVATTPTSGTISSANASPR